jgi:hypothetical protein
LNSTGAGLIASARRVLDSPFSERYLWTRLSGLAFPSFRKTAPGAIWYVPTTCVTAPTVGRYKRDLLCWRQAFPRSSPRRKIKVPCRKRRHTWLRQRGYRPSDFTGGQGTAIVTKPQHGLPACELEGIQGLGLARKAVEHGAACCCEGNRIPPAKPRALRRSLCVLERLAIRSGVVECRVIAQLARWAAANAGQSGTMRSAISSVERRWATITREIGSRRIASLIVRSFSSSR